MYKLLSKAIIRSIYHLLSFFYVVNAMLVLDTIIFSTENSCMIRIIIPALQIFKASGQCINKFLVTITEFLRQANFIRREVHTHSFTGSRAKGQHGLSSADDALGSVTRWRETVAEAITPPNRKPDSDSRSGSGFYENPVST